jgi:uncharacterized protein YpmB
MRRPVWIGIIFVLLVIGGVAYFSFAPRTDANLVALDQLPAGFLETARRQLPQVNFVNAYKLSNGNYEIRGKDAKGKLREVEVNSKGEVVEVN